MTKVLFLEGPAYAGKTTFLRNLPNTQYIKLPEASEYLGGDMNFPEAPFDIESMLRCTYFFGHMEALRMQSLNTAAQTVVADRFTPLSSLIFYGLRHQTGAISDGDYAIGMQLCAALFAKLVRLPQDTEVAFLTFDISSQEVFERRLARGTRNGEFNSWQNFRSVADVYEPLLTPYAERCLDGVYDLAAATPAYHPAAVLDSILKGRDVSMSDEEVAARIAQLVPQTVIDELYKQVEDLIDEQ